MSEAIITNEPKPTSFRITDTTKEKLKEISKENGWNQEETFSKLIAIHEIEQAKMIITGRRTEIETFETHLHALSEVYRMSLQLNQDAEERIRTSYETTLISNQKTIADLQEQKEKDKLTISLSKESIEDLTKQLGISLKDFKGLESEMVKTESLCLEYKEKNDTLNGLLTEYKEDREYQKELKKQMEQLESQNQTLLNQIAEKERGLQGKEENITLLKKEMEQQTKENQKNIELSQKQAESDLKMAVLDTKAEYNTIIEELKRNSNKEYRELLEQLEELRKENHQLEKSLLQKHDFDLTPKSNEQSGETPSKQKPTSTTTRGKKKAEEKQDNS